MLSHSRGFLLECFVYGKLKSASLIWFSKFFGLFNPSCALFFFFFLKLYQLLELCVFFSLDHLLAQNIGSCMNIMGTREQLQFI